jgi:hypothetical protein
MEYKFVKLEPSFFSDKPDVNYKEIIQEHAREGWRLVQIFAPPSGGFGKSEYFEIIFEKSEE